MHVTDFGIARVWNPNNAQDTSGTPGYMGTSLCSSLAPEVMCRQNHGVAADYFALGVIVYECIMGKASPRFYLQRPYQGKTRKEIREQILARQAGLKPHEVPEGWSAEAVDFVNKVSAPPRRVAAATQTCLAPRT